MTDAEITYVVDPVLDPVALDELWRAAWNGVPAHDRERIHRRSLGWIGAYAGARLVGYVNIAWDGDEHAFLLDPTVHPELQRRGIGRAPVGRATELARAHGTHWLHVDFDPHLTGFYRGCGFRPTEAGLAAS